MWLTCAQLYRSPRESLDHSKEASTSTHHMSDTLPPLRLQKYLPAPSCVAGYALSRATHCISPKNLLGNPDWYIE
jgi:hypothetical protein